MPKPTAREKQQMSLIGMTIGDRYEVIEPLGSGGYSVVYKGRHKLMNRNVAIKIMHVDIVHHDSELAKKRFLQEAQAAAGLSHTNLVTALDFGYINEDQPYFVMDFMEGDTLQHILNRKGYMHVDDAVEMFIQACDGISHAHDNGVVHRDLKPSNIMIVENKLREKIVKIVDFGVAKLILGEGNELERLTRSGETLGTSLYMSPEQCCGRNLDHRTDIYSFGCVMYETLTGVPPFVGDNALDTMQKHINGKIPACAEARGDLLFPGRLENIVAKCLAKSPDDRYQSMRELKKDLEGLRPGAPGVVQAPAATEPSGPLKTGGYKVIGIACAVGLAMVGGGLIWFYKPQAPVKVVQTLAPSPPPAASPTTSPAASPATSPAAVKVVQALAPADKKAADEKTKAEKLKAEKAKAELAKAEKAKADKAKADKAKADKVKAELAKAEKDKADKKALVALPLPKPQPAATVAASAPNMDFGPYMARVQRKLRRSWIPPANASTKPITVNFSITRDGGVSAVKLLKGGRRMSTEGQAALKAVQAAAPFPPLPVGAPDTIDIEFTFEQ